MRDVLDYQLDAAGFLASIPYLLMAGTVILGGYIADHVRTTQRLSTTQVRKMFTCGAYLCQVGRQYPPVGTAMVFMTVYIVSRCS